MVNPATSPRASAVLYAYMMHSHDYLRGLFERLLAAMAANATSDICAMWTELDHGLHAHMAAEERHVLPAFAKVDRDEALALLRDHGMFRELLLELGVAIDLHCLRYERSHEFIALLRAHAEREDRLLYHWADQHLTANVIEAVKIAVAAP